MDLKNISPEEIKNMDYNQLIGIVRETNRPPGGKSSIFEIINRLHITKRTKILEIGTSTGFTPIEISRIVRCPIVSIDINEDSLTEAKNRAEKEGYHNIDFQKGDVNELSFNDDLFNIVIVGNVFSLLSDKKRALKECARVCKKDGFIITMPMYYIKEPSDVLVKKVSKAIGITITPMYKKDWINFLFVEDLETYWSKDFIFDFISDEKIGDFLNDIMNRPHLKDLHKEAHLELLKTYKEFMFLFRDNLSHMGYSIMILIKKRIWEDPELFTSQERK